MLEVTALEYQQNEAEEGMVGVDGLYPFSIKGLKSGRTEITFQYCRSGVSGPSAAAPGACCKSAEKRPVFLGKKALDNAPLNE